MSPNHSTARRKLACGVTNLGHRCYSLQTWHLMAPIDMLPVEVVRMCFVFLPFQDRLAVTLVSCFWREIALASPEIWTDIYISSHMRSPGSALALILSRTGRRPVDLSVSQHNLGDINEGCFTAALNPHVDQLRSIELNGPFWTFEYPAQALESFTFTPFRSSAFHLTQNFLGGRLGKLRRLDINSASLPGSCPAVAAVTELRLVLPIIGPDGLSGLFSLFPQLRFLALFNIEASHSIILRGLRPPSTLSELQLETISGDIDLLDLYDSWSENLTDVRLVLYRFVTSDLRLTPFLSDALKLVVSLSDPARIIVTDSRTRKRTMIFRSFWNLVIVKGLQAAHGCLAHVQSLTISAVALSDISMRGPFPLPALKTLTLRLDQERQRRRVIEEAGEVSSYMWPWHALGNLSVFLRSLDVETLALEMRCLSRATPPTLKDGRKLLREYVPSLARAARRVRVRGFPRDVVDGLSSELRALQIDRDVEIALRPSSIV